MNELINKNGAWTFKGVPIINPKLFELLSIHGAFLYDDEEFIEDNYPLLTNCWYSNYTPALKQYFNQEELKEFFMFLKQHDPWGYMCLRGETEKNQGTYYRGFVFYVVKMQSKPQRNGLPESSHSWVRNGGRQRPAITYQVEVLKESKDWSEDAKIMWYGYMEGYYRSQTVLFDCTLVHAKLV
jgi:hypothetical protein